MVDTRAAGAKRRIAVESSLPFATSSGMSANSRVVRRARCHRKRRSMPPGGQHRKGARADRRPLRRKRAAPRGCTVHDARSRFLDRAATPAFAPRRCRHGRQTETARRSRAASQAARGGSVPAVQWIALNRHVAKADDFGVVSLPGAMQSVDEVSIWATEVDSSIATMSRPCDRLNPLYPCGTYRTAPSSQINGSADRDGRIRSTSGRVRFEHKTIGISRSMICAEPRPVQ